VRGGVVAEVWVCIRWVALAGLCAPLFACGDDDSATASTNPSGRTHDRDASAPTAPIIDASEPSGPDHELRSGDTYLCGWNDADALELAGNFGFGELAIATDERGFALVHHDDKGALRIEAIPIGQSAQPSVRLIDGADAPGRSVVAAAQERFLLLYRDGSQLAARALEQHASPIMLSDHLAEPAADGERFALTALDDHFVAAWIDGDGETAGLHIQALALDGTPLADAASLDTLVTQAPLDVELGRLDRERVILAWHEQDDAGAGRVMAVSLDADLAAEHAAVQLSKNAVAEARFDLDARQLSAGVIYQAREGGTRDTVKYRRVDPQGEATQPELSIVNAPGRARDGAIAAFGQGYAVAYRVLPSLGVDQAAIRVAFINQFGRVVYEDELAASSENGGPTSVSASIDGHLVVGWNSTGANGSATMHAIQLDCPGALKLCGGGIDH
jgi:hypothetical protein